MWDASLVMNFANRKSQNPMVLAFSCFYLERY